MHVPVSQLVDIASDMVFAQEEDRDELYRRLDLLTKSMENGLSRLAKIQLLDEAIDGLQFSFSFMEVL